MIFRYILYLAISVGVYWIGNHFTINYKYEDYKDFLTLISGVSGMVFTIMGIWIAFLYPNALSRLVNPTKIITADFSDSLADAKRLENIVAAVLKSAFVMISALLITMTKIFLYLTPIYIEYRFEIKYSALAVLVFITIMQIEAVFSVIISNVMFINELHWRRQDRKSQEDL